MNGQERVNALDLDDQLAADNEIQPASIDRFVSIYDTNKLLSLVSNSLDVELEAECARVSLLGITRSERLMDCDAATNYALDELVRLGWQRGGNSQHR